MTSMVANNISSNWQWSWTTLCGPEGMRVWSSERHDIGFCFQQLFLQSPALIILACSSSYYFGRLIGFVSRGKVPLYAINLRCLIVLLLALLPLLHVYISLNETPDKVYYVSYFLHALQGICWLSHALYILALRKRLGMSPRGPVFICVIWTLNLVLTIISLRSHLLIYEHAVGPDYFINVSYGFTLCYVILQILYALTLVPGPGSSTYLTFDRRYTEIGEREPLLQNHYIRFLEEGDPSYLGVAMEMDGCLSKMLFYWVTPLMEKGVQGKLRNTDDLFDLPIALNCGTLSHKLEKALTGCSDNHKRSLRDLNEQTSASVSSCETPTSVEVSFVKVPKHKATLFRGLHKCFWFEFYSVGILKLISDMAGFAGPLLLNKLVSFIENRSEDIKWGYIYASALLVTSLIGSFCDTHFNFLMSIVGLRMRGALVTTVYRKTLTVSSTVLNSAFSVGEIVNFMSTDTERIVNACPSFHALWSIPFQLIVTLYLLYNQVGLAFLAGVAFSIILIPINKIIANKIGELSTKLMERKDERVKLVTEVLRGIRAIKLYVWEQHFIYLINKLREQEIKYLKGRKYLDALCVYFWATTPVLISILTFSTYALLGHKLTAATVFTGIALLNMLIGPLNAFPWVLNGVTEAFVSIKRIQRLLDLPDLDLDLYYDDDLIDDNENCDIVIRRGTFSWGRPLSGEEKKKLHSSLDIFKKHRGKSKSKMRLIATQSIEEEPVEDDVQVFKLKDISVKVKKGEFLGIIGPVGSGKSTILSSILAELKISEGYIGISQMESGFGYVSQQAWLQRGTIRENILFGRAYEETRYQQILYSCGLAEDLAAFPGGDLTGVGEAGHSLSGGQRVRIALARAVYQDKAVYLLDDILSALDTKVARHVFTNCILGLLRNKTRLLATHSLQYLMHADRVLMISDGKIEQIGSPTAVLSAVDDSIPIDLELASDGCSESVSSSLMTSIQRSTSEKETDNTDSLLEAEYSATGGLRPGVYGAYWRAAGHLLAIFVLLTAGMMQFSRNITDWWLARWVSQVSNNTSNGTEEYLMIYEREIDDSTSYYLEVYAGFAAVNTVFTLLRAFLFAYGGVVAAAKLHKLLLKSIVKAKSTFFDISPVGRILNRFSSDTYTVDDSLPFILNILLAQFFGLLGTVFITIYGLPWICLILVPLIPVYHWIQYYYRLTSRELKRISSVSLSPIYSHFNESLEGLTSIRAMRVTQRFKRDNEDNVEANLKAQFASQAAARWMGLRLQFIGVAMIGGVGFIAVIQHQYDVADPGMVGLALSYALSVTGALNAVVSAFTETERELVAVERVDQYIQEVPLEPTYAATDPPFGWPSYGVLSFEGVVLRYREHLAPSLINVTFQSRPGEKIGVVGRTGSGKSSLIQVLFRLVDPHSGRICIDSVDVASIPIAALRSRMFCIPQEPFLFEGTLRENLDPLGEYREQELWSALGKVNQAESVRRSGGLDSRVDPGGSNFSAGQKQLLCLARAILRNAKILCIDEATANIDRETERQIRGCLQSAFRSATVLTVAHRVDTVLDSDRILVMSEGRVAEFDTPHTLLADPQSMFYQLVHRQE